MVECRGNSDGKESERKRVKDSRVSAAAGWPEGKVCWVKGRGVRSQSTIHANTPKVGIRLHHTVCETGETVDELGDVARNCVVLLTETKGLSPLCPRMGAAGCNAYFAELVEGLQRPESANGSPAK